VNQGNEPESRQEDPVVAANGARLSKPGDKGRGAMERNDDRDATHSGLLPEGRSAHALRHSAMSAQAGCARSDIAMRATSLHGGAGCITV
jgi:hypothetical protein